jgi:hypothetical protein
MSKEDFKMKRGWVIGLVVAVAVVVGVAAFFGGRASAGGGTPSPEEAMAVIQNLSPEERAQLPQNGEDTGTLGSGPGGTGPRSSAGRAGGSISGSIVSMDDTSITVKSADGNTKIVFYSDSTTISESKDVSSDALTVGEDVTVAGSTNTDGSVTAARIQLGTVPGGPPNQGAAPGGATGGATGGASGAAGGPRGASGAGSAPVAPGN